MQLSKFIWPYLHQNFRHPYEAEFFGGGTDTGVLLNRLSSSSKQTIDILPAQNIFCASANLYSWGLFSGRFLQA